MRGVEDLFAYNQYKKSADGKRDYIAVIEAEMRAIKSGVNGEAVRGGGGGNKLDTLIDKKDRLKAELERVESILRMVENAVGRLPERDQTVLRRFYLEDNSSTQACELLMDDLTLSTPRWAYRLRNKALEAYETLWEDIDH